MGGFLDELGGIGNAFSGTIQDVVSGVGQTYQANAAMNAANAQQQAANAAYTLEAAELEREKYAARQQNIKTVATWGGLLLIVVVVGLIFLNRK